MNLTTWRLDDDRFLRVLSGMIAVSERLQNFPQKDKPQPQEDLAGDVVVKELQPFVRRDGLRIEGVSYAEGRGNLILTYPVKTDRTVAFFGSHLDVVSADPVEWQRPPFELRIHE